MTEESQEISKHIQRVETEVIDSTLVVDVHVNDDSVMEEAELLTIQGSTDTQQAARGVAESAVWGELKTINGFDDPDIETLVRIHSNIVMKL